METIVTVFSDQKKLITKAWFIWTIITYNDQRIVRLSMTRGPREKVSRIGGAYVEFFIFKIQAIIYRTVFFFLDLTYRAWKFACTVWKFDD